MLKAIYDEARSLDSGQHHVRSIREIRLVRRESGIGIRPDMDQAIDSRSIGSSKENLQ